MTPARAAGRASSGHAGEGEQDRETDEGEGDEEDAAEVGGVE